MSNNNSWETEGLPWLLTEDKVKKCSKLTVVMPEGESKTILSTDSDFEDALKAIREGNWKELPNLMCPEKRIFTFSEGNFVVKDEFVYYNDQKLPDVLSERIISFSKNKLPYQPLLKFWENLQENPSFRAVQELYGFLLKYSYAITGDGCFVAYKGVNKNFTDCHTGTIDNHPGTVVSMPRNKVNEDSTQTCSYGLHVASYDYAHTQFGAGSSPDRCTLIVKVNPKDVVAIPKDYHEAKMRVCEYKVLNIVNGELTEPLHEENDPQLDDGDGSYSDDTEEVIGGNH